MTPEPRNGRFSGPLDASRETTLARVALWQLSRLRRLFRPKPSGHPLEVIDERASLHREEDFICWLGHASVLLQLGGTRILFDPVFGGIPFYRRHTPAPYPPEALLPVDLVCVSHAHYDHCDVPSLAALNASGATVALPRGNAATVAKAAPSLACRELEWFESFEHKGVRVTLVPSRHMSRRTPFDNNRSLWGGFVVEGNGTTLYFAGDTGPGPHFSEIGRRFGIDAALLPISSYAPEFVMHATHLSPEGAWEAFEALGASTLFPMHYGTFDLSDEPLDEPFERMKKIALAHPEQVHFLTTGAVTSFNV